MGTAAKACGIILLLLLAEGAAYPAMGQLANPLFLPRRSEPVIASATGLASRSALYAPPEFSRVSPEELAMQATHDFPYEVLDRTRVVSFAQREGGILAVIEDQVRVKILTDEPRAQLEAGLVTLPILRGDERERVDRIHGITHHVDGSWTELSPTDIRRTQYSDRVDLVEFVLPEIREGSVLEYRYRIVRTGIERLPDFRFSDRVPVRRAALHVIPPPYLRYTEQLRDPEERVRFTGERIDTSNVRRLFSERGPEPLFIASWVAEGLPPEEVSYESEPAADAGVSIRFLIGEFGLPRQSLENSWDVVEAQIRRHSDPFAVTAAAVGLQAVGDSLARAVRQEWEPLAYDAAPRTADGNQTGQGLEIVHRAFEWVTGRLRANHSLSVSPDTLLLDRAAELPSVNQATMNLALMAVLEGAGMQVRPVYHSAGRFGALDTLFPSVFQLQGVLLAVDGVGELDGRPLLLDASHEYGRVGMMDPEVSGQSGFRLDRDRGADWVELRGVEDRHWSAFELDGRLTVEGALAGTLRVELRGYAARSASKAVSEGQDPSEYVQLVFLDRYPEVSLGGTRFDDRFGREGSVHIEAPFTLPGYALDFTDAFDLQPLPVGYLSENPYQAELRRTTLEMQAPEWLDVRVSLALPAGFRPEVPAGDSLAVDGAAFRLRVQPIDQGRPVLRYRATLDRRATRFPVDAYPVLREMYMNWIELSTTRWRIAK